MIYHIISFIFFHSRKYKRFVRQINMDANSKKI